MSESDVNAILVAFTDFKATVTTKLDTIASDNTRGEGVHQDHELRIRALESKQSEGIGVWKVLTAGGLVGGGAVGVLAIVLRSLGA